MPSQFPCVLSTKAVAVATVVTLAIGQPADAELTLKISHRARAVQPGEVVALEVRPSELPITVGATAFGGSVRFFPIADDDDTWVALVGIDLTAPPGAHLVAVHATARDGTTVHQTYSLGVEPKEFQTRRLNVAPNFVSPPAEVIERIQREARQLAGIFATATDERFWDGGFLRPVSGDSTSSFGRRSVFNGEARSPHSGTDFRAPEGTPIKAPNDGVVVLATDLYFSGNVVILDHGWGLYSFFAHLSSINVAVGDRVAQGAVVGQVGATGRVTGPHLHWTVRLNDARVDPLSLMQLFPATENH